MHNQHAADMQYIYPPSENLCDNLLLLPFSIEMCKISTCPSQRGGGIISLCLLANSPSVLFVSCQMDDDGDIGIGNWIKLEVSGIRRLEWLAAAAMAVRAADVRLYVFF